MTGTNGYIPLAQPMLGDDEIAAATRVIASGHLAAGPEVAAFEAEFGELVEHRQCVAVNSGTAALHLGLLAAGIGAGDEVVVPSFSFAATANAVVLAGAIPVFADIDPRTFCLDPAAAAAAITSRTAALMPVHLYGQPADMTAIRALAGRHGLLIVEDAAQAHLARWDSRPAGCWGTVAAFSFYPTKNMTTGEGGMIVTDDAQFARRARLLRNQGMRARYENELIGFNARMSDLHAALGRVQLARLPGFTAARRRNAATLDELITQVAPPFTAPRAHHVYHQYTVRIPADRRDQVRSRLHELGVGSAVYYPTPIHRLPAYDLDLDLPHTQSAAAEVLSLPVHPGLTPTEVTRVAEQLDAVMRESGA